MRKREMEKRLQRGLVSRADCKIRVSGYTIGMKTAVSIPDPVYQDAERLAKRLNTSRSELYARALAQFIGDHAPDRVTEALNAVVDATDTASDEFVQAAARRMIDRAEW